MFIYLIIFALTNIYILREGGFISIGIFVICIAVCQTFCNIMD